MILNSPAVHLLIPVSPPLEGDTTGLMAAKAEILGFPICICLVYAQVCALVSMCVGAEAENMQVQYFSGCPSTLREPRSAFLQSSARGILLCNQEITLKPG